MPRKRGFTLIELLLTLIVLGVVTTIAVFTYGRMRDRAIVAAARADLRHIAPAQELYHQTHDFAYAGDVETLTQAGFFRPSLGISVEITALPMRAGKPQPPTWPPECHVRSPRSRARSNVCTTRRVTNARSRDLRVA